MDKKRSGEGWRVKDRRWSGEKGRGKGGRGSGVRVWEGKGSREGKG